MVMFGYWNQSTVDESRQRLSRKCVTTSSALESCLGANGRGGEASCRNLKMQLVYCQAMILCKQHAEEYGRCMERTVRRKREYGECDDVYNRMERCLFSLRNKRFLLPQRG